MSVVRFMMGSFLPLTSMVSWQTVSHTLSIRIEKTCFGEIHQDLSHFVAAFTAADVDDNVTVGELGQRLANDGLAATKSTGNAHGATLHTGEEGIKDTLADNQGLGRGELVGRGAGYTDGPVLHHAVLGLDAIELDLQDLLIHGVAPLVRDACDGSTGPRGQHDLVVAEEAVLNDGSKDIAASNVVSDL